MIGFRGQRDLTLEVASGVLHATASTSYNVVLPPGFGQDIFAKDVAEELRRRDPRALIATLSSDNVQSVRDYVTRLHTQWGETVKIPEVRSDVQIDAALKALLHSLPQGRRAVQIVTRFDKILDSLDQFVLGALRDAENLTRLRSVILSPYGYVELKKRWTHGGQVLTASDYGDTHAVREIEPASSEEIMAMLEGNAQVPGHVARFVLELTGGYPAAFRHVVDEWIRRGEPDLRPEIRSHLRAEAERRVRRFVRKLDLPDESHYRDLVLDLHQGVEVEQALLELSHHPWHSALLQEDGLRAEAVGAAAVSAALEDAIGEQRVRDVPAAVLARGRILYERRQYAAAVRLLDAVERTHPTPSIKLLHEHARVMSTLYADDSGEAGIDTDWRRLRRSVQAARRIASDAQLAMKLNPALEDRYGELDTLVERIESASRTGNMRVVDGLAGFRSEQGDPGTSLLLMALKIRAGKALAGNASACHCVLAVPEQIFRTWALWAIGVNFYKAPEGEEEVWRSVSESWAQGTLAIATPGAEFPSFSSFAHFCLELWTVRHGRQGVAPEVDRKGLARALGVLSVRRDHAHALALATASTRKQLFELIDRWFNALLAPCKVHGGFTMEQVVAPIEPLPILDEEGTVVWSE